MTSALLNQWGITPGASKESRNEYVGENAERFVFPETWSQLSDMLRDPEFSKVASRAMLKEIRALCDLNQVLLSDLFIFNDEELADLQDWDEKYNPIITLAATRYEDMHRDSS